MVNEGLVRDSLLKMFHNLGGHWNPVRGPYPSYNPIDPITIDPNFQRPGHLFDVAPHGRKVALKSVLDSHI